jgi:hypothetical protein
MESNWTSNFKAWQAFADSIRARVQSCDRMREDRAWSLAASVGIPRCGCSLHNASIDDAMTGWCAGNPMRLKIAKRANHILSDCRASQIASRITSRAWDKMVHD